MQRNGFTIIELIVIIVVIAILASISIIGYGTWRDQAAETEVKTDLHSAAVALESYKNFNSIYPTSLPTTFRGSNNVTTTLNGTCLQAVSKARPGIKMHIELSSGGDLVNGECAV